MSDGFDLLAEDTRADILRELAAARREQPQAPHLSFSELRDRVGAVDSGRFNYHLGELRGHFVDRTDDGYALSPVGQQAAGAILAGWFDDPPDCDPVRLDGTCGRCDGPLEARYGDGMLVVDCENDHRFADALPPRILEDHTLREAIDVLDAKLRREVALARRGACPTCFGPVEWTFEQDLRTDAAVDHLYAVGCQHCGHQQGVLPGIAVHDHPALVAAYRADGVDLRERPLWTIDCCLPGASSLVSEDPFRVALDAGPDGDQRFLLDGNGDVVRSPGTASR